MSRVVGIIILLNSLFIIVKNVFTTSAAMAKLFTLYLQVILKLVKVN